MKRRKYIIILAVAVVVLSLFWLLRVPSQKSNGDSAPVPVTMPESAQPQSPPIAQAERFKEASALVDSVFSAPIAFYGRVIDQNGDPVPYANVGYTAADKFNASGSNYTGQADEKGNFQITGVKGAALAVAVRKEGYYFVDEITDRSVLSSAATFAFGMGPDSYRRPAPSKDKPAVFVLHKMGKPEALIYIGTRSYKVSKDGQPLEVKLETGGQAPIGQGDIRFERWASDKEKNQRGHFDWRFRITATEGGLIERQGEFDFEAPIGGYHENFEIDMPASLGEKWDYTANKSFFVKLSNGRFGRLNVTIQAGHNTTPLLVTAYINPTPGDRNLEFDPEKAIKP